MDEEDKSLETVVFCDHVAEWEGNVRFTVLNMDGTPKADREYPFGEIIIKQGKESQEHMADTRTDELYRALQDKRAIPMSCAGRSPISI